MTRKINLLLLLNFLIALLFTPFFQAQAQKTIFGGTEDKETGEKVGLCLNEPQNPECEGVNCQAIEFKDDVRCISEAEAGTALVQEELSSTGLTGTENFGDLVIKIINFMLPYLTLAAFVGFVVAGVYYVTAFGNDEQLTKAKTVLIWSVVGLILVIFSFAIVQFFTSGLLGRL